MWIIIFICTSAYMLLSQINGHIRYNDAKMDIFGAATTTTKRTKFSHSFLWEMCVCVYIIEMMWIWRCLHSIFLLRQFSECIFNFVSPELRRRHLGYLLPFLGIYIQNPRFESFISFKRTQTNDSSTCATRTTRSHNSLHSDRLVMVHQV